jgi:plastocyanin
VRTEPPAITVPLNAFEADGHTHPILEPPWPVKKVRDGATIHLRGFRFTPVHVEIKAGDTLNFRFDDRTPHNLTFANGPRIVRGPTANNGARWPWKFTVAGRYELFCYLHPVTMHEVVEVLPRQ